jgi:transposase
MSPVTGLRFCHPNREADIIDAVARQRALAQVESGDLTAAAAAALLGRSVRQVRRLLAAYRRDGPAALVHGNRGRSPAHTLDPDIATAVRRLAESTYAGCNDVHLAELLAEHEGIVVSRSTVCRLRQAAMPVARRRPPAHRRRRERRPRAGMLLQLDGSPHAWLEDRRPRLTLLAAIDGATGRVVAPLFRPQEDAAGYLEVLYRIARGPGVPEAVYHDRHSIFVVHPAGPPTLAEDLAGEREPTQVARALQELGITAIAARSPQAKGRVERLFGTLQDRLVSELRLAEAATPAEAETVLQALVPRFNARFDVPATDPAPAWRTLPPGRDPWRVCAFRYQRRVGGDATVAIAGQRLLLTPDARRGLPAWMEVRTHLDGSLSVWQGDHRLAWTPAPAEAPLLRARGLSRGAAPADATPAASSGEWWDDPGQADSAAVTHAVPTCPARPAGPFASHTWRRRYKTDG